MKPSAVDIAIEYLKQFVTVIPRDEKTVLRLRGPYNTADVDYWPSTGTCRQVMPTAETHRRRGGIFAAKLALHGNVHTAKSLSLHGDSR